MLQNRVNPFGEIIRTPARGSLMGNRGVIHSEHQQITRPWRLKAWITCVLEFKGKWRKVMTPNRWTELFFFDEATAFSAGHRPCFECRRADALRFKRAWLAGNPEQKFNEKTPIAFIDEILHRERIAKDGSKIRHEEKLAALPNGTFIDLNNAPYLVWAGQLYKWTPEGYSLEATVPGNRTSAMPEPGSRKTEAHNSQNPSPDSIVRVLTPRSIVNAFRAGYIPAIRLEKQDL
jgi:hypothetical protein